MDFAAFEALSKTRRIVPVYREVVSDGVTPVGLYHGLVGEGQGFLLESVEGGDRWGRYSFVGRASADRLTATGSVVTR
ncbi:MAG: anthranilate synthase component I, partial [Actinobacteria bacterium]|nr:anthranilate synthase component I [Actinomycetota bacterium]